MIELKRKKKIKKLKATDTNTGRGGSHCKAARVGSLHIHQRQKQFIKASPQAVLMEDIASPQKTVPGVLVAPAAGCLKQTPGGGQLSWERGEMPSSSKRPGGCTGQVQTALYYTGGAARSAGCRPGCRTCPRGPRGRQVCQAAEPGRARGKPAQCLPGPRGFPSIPGRCPARGRVRPAYLPAASGDAPAPPQRRALQPCARSPL